MARSHLILASLVAAAAPALAQSTESLDAIPPPFTAMPARPFVGAAQHRVALTVPAWRGLEPTLAVAYASPSKNDWLGVGMTLEGLSTIERVSASRGVPTYTASDTYLLDGEPVLACVAGSPSPSCLSGGTHTTQHERYARIVKAGSTWTITAPTGVVDQYTTLAEPFAVLTSRTDTSGNAVSYGYATHAGTTYLASISYNGTVITFAREARPDAILVGTGATHRRIEHRLIAVAIRTDGALERAYRLTYTNPTLPAGDGGWMGPNTASGRSFLTGVQEFGSDATFNGAGAVTGGSALPATSLAYNSDVTTLSNSWSAVITRTAGVTDDVSLIADINGDGRADAVAIRRRTTTSGTTSTGSLTLMVALGQANGSFSTAARTSTSTSNAEIGWYDDTRTGDVNGDGRADLIFVRRKSTYACCGVAPAGFAEVQLALGDATGGFTFPAKHQISSVGDTSQYKEVVVADLDGNGRSDLVLLRFNSSSGVYSASNALVSLSDGTRLGTATARTLNISNASGGFSTSPSFASAKLHAGDVNGDGRDDLVVVRRASSICGTNLAVGNVHLSAGNGTFAAPVYSLLSSACSNASFVGDMLVDVNNDGLADLVGDKAYSVYGAVCSDCDSDVSIVANLGNGNGTFGGPIDSTGWSGAGVGIGSFTASFADVNGDKFADRVAIKGGSSVSVLVSLGRGNGSFLPGSVTSATGASTAWINGGPVTVADVDGDGRVSPVATYCQGTSWRLLTLAPSAAFSGLLTSATLPSGGSVGFEYTTSSSFPNSYLPFAFPVLATSRLLDGRGQNAATTYSYTGGLYARSERRFLGFATARIKDPANPYRDVAYTQHVADPPGAIASTHERTAAGALVRYESTTFARSGNGTTAPYTSAPSRRYAYECNGQATCKASSRGWTYSAYGAVRSEIEYGDDAITGDERTTYRTQVVNPTAFLTQLDATITVRAGAGAPAGTQLAYSELAYDDATAATTAPTRGLVTRRSRWRGGTSFVVDRSQYDLAGNEVARIDPLGHTTALAYDARQRLISTVNPLGHTETRTYDTRGRLATITDPNGGITSHGYDAVGRLVSRTTPDGGVATATFTNWGNASTQYVTTTIADGTADGLWTRTYLDGLGRTVRVVAEGGITTDTTFGVRGLVTARSAPYLTGATPVWTTTTYDAIRRPLVVTEPDGATTTTIYGNWSTTTTDPRGLVTDRFFDGYQQLARVVERITTPTVSAHTTNLGYDLLGQRVSVVDAKGNTTTSTFDPLGRRIQSADPDLGLWLYSYDDAGRVTTQTDARGVTTELSYDALGRPLQRRAGTEVLATFTYDEAAAGAANVGRLTSFTDPTGATRRDYDPAGRLRAEQKTIGADTYRLDWAFDAAGRLTSITYPAVAGVREQVGLTYDASGRPASVGAYVAGLAYNARGAVTAATYGNGATVARTYSPTRGWMLSQTVTAGATVVDQFAVTRALSGDITARTSSVETRDAWAFGYDPFGRLTTANNTADDTLDEAFTYDAIGNRLTAQRGTATSAYQYPATGAARPHAPTTVGGIALRYDANGNRLGVGLSVDASYDANNRLVDDGTTTYAYDAEGTRVRAGTKVFVRDLIEIDGATSTRYYYLGRERVARRDQTGAVAYYHADSIGTVRALTSASGAVAGTRRGFAFGELAATTGLEDPFALAGARRDGSGLYHLNARMMDPARGQFTQPDPSGAPDPSRPQTLNRYVYADNNPIRISDPTGFEGKPEEDKEKEKEKEKKPDAGPLQIKVRRGTSETVEWTRGDAPDKVIAAPRVYSRSFYDQPAMKTGEGVRWAFESQTGRLFGSGAYIGAPFETLGDALDYIDRGRSPTGAPSSDSLYGVERIDAWWATRVQAPFEQQKSEPQYLEGTRGTIYRYGNSGTLDPVAPSEVPPGVGIDALHPMFIFNEDLSS